MTFDDLSDILGKEYRFKPYHSPRLIDFVLKTQSLAKVEFKLGYHLCRASSERFVLKQMPESQLEKLLRFHQEILPRITLNGHEIGNKRASMIHQGMANIYARMFETDSNSCHLEKAIEHSVKLMEFSKSEEHKSYTLGFIAEYARKIFQQTKNLHYAKKSLEAYQQSREKSNNDSHRAHCKSYMADVFRDRFELTNNIFDADRSIKNYIDSAEEFKKLKPEQVFHNLAYAGDVAFSVFSKIGKTSYLKKAYSIYHNVLKECNEKHKEPYVRLNILKCTVNLYDRLHDPEFVKEAFYQTVNSIQHNLTPKSQSFVLSLMSDLCVRLPPNFVISLDYLKIMEQFAEKFPEDQRAHIFLSSLYRNRFEQTQEENDINLIFSSLERAIETSISERQKAFSRYWAGRTIHSIYSTTNNIEMLKKSYNYHDLASVEILKSNFYAGLSAQELYDLTKEEHWKNKALAKYVQYLNLNPLDLDKINDSRRHIQELTE